MSPTSGSNPRTNTPRPGATPVRSTYAPTEGVGFYAALAALVTELLTVLYFFWTGSPLWMEIFLALMFLGPWVILICSVVAIWRGRHRVGWRAGFAFWTGLATLLVGIGWTTFVVATVASGNFNP